MKSNKHGFTLIELLVVMGLIALLAGFFVSGLSDRGHGTALQASQALLTNLLTASRARAVASGHDVRLLVQADARWPERFRCAIVMQENTTGTLWVTVHEAKLSKGVYFLAYDSRTPAGIFENPSAWRKIDGSSPLQSSAFSSTPVSAQAGSEDTETWDFVLFGSKGTSSTSGDIVLGVGRVRAPGTYATSDSPVQLENPELVRGVSLSAYGLPNLINGRASF